MRRRRIGVSDDVVELGSSILAFNVKTDDMNSVGRTTAAP
jgi:hypothetical protein